MNNPVFSIITITWNAEKVLEPTIQSILEQDYPNIEYLIIDGGSTDQTMPIVDRYRDRIAYIVSEKDKGLYDAMNKGLQAATGDYIWFINAGDAIHSPFTVSNIVRKIALGGTKGNLLPEVIYGETAIIDQTRTFKGMRRLKAPEDLTWKHFRNGMLVCHQSFLVRRDIAPQYDLSYRYSADFDWCIRAMKLAGNIYNTHLILSDYLDEGITTNNRNASLKERFQIMCRYYGHMRVVIYHLWFACRFIVAKLAGKE